MVDWGIISRLDDDSQLMFTRMCEAALGNEEAWDDIAAVMIRSGGPSFYALGLDDAQIRQFVKTSMEPILTQPLGDVSMASAFVTGDDIVRMATGEAPPKRSFRQKRTSMRDAARAYQSAVTSDAFDKPANRMGVLSMKQLVYLERYGRMYIPDESLLGDHEFLRRALAGS